MVPLNAGCTSSSWSQGDIEGASAPRYDAALNQRLPPFTGDPCSGHAFSIRRTTSYKQRHGFRCNWGRTGLLSCVQLTSLILKTKASSGYIRHQIEVDNEVLSKR